MSHQEHSTRRPPYVCTYCRDCRCDECMDVKRATVGFSDPLCACRRAEHGIRREQVPAFAG